MTPPLPLEDAQALLLALVEPLSPETIATQDAMGRCLAAPLLARRTQPAADLSAMDGYAVRADDLAGPWRVIGESAAGHPFPGTPKAGEAVRISTGALLPNGAEAVIVQEDVAREGDVLTLTGDGPDTPRRHVRPKGMDFQEGDAVAPAGAPLGPAALALALTAGHANLGVHRLPLLAVIDSGDELSADPQDCPPHRLPASNGAMLKALATPLCASVQRIGPVQDRLDAVLAALDQARDADVIVTSGGASVGDHDLIRPALEEWGAELAFWRVAIKPGKPLLIATRKDSHRRQIIIGLPGNPVSAFVTGYLFLLPLLRRLGGAASPLPRAISTRLAGPTPNTGGRREFVRGIWDGESVAPIALRDSGALTSLAHANALIDLPANTPVRLTGEKARIYLIGNGGIA